MIVPINTATVAQPKGTESYTAFANAGRDSTVDVAVRIVAVRKYMSSTRCRTSDNRGMIASIAPLGACSSFCPSTSSAAIAPVNLLVLFESIEASDVRLVLLPSAVAEPPAYSFENGVWKFLTDIRPSKNVVADNRRTIEGRCCCSFSFSSLLLCLAFSIFSSFFFAFSDAVETTSTVRRSKWNVAATPAATIAELGAMVVLFCS